MSVITGCHLEFAPNRLAKAQTQSQMSDTKARLRRDVNTQVNLYRAAFPLSVPSVIMRRLRFAVWSCGYWFREGIWHVPKSEDDVGRRLHGFIRSGAVLLVASAQPALASLHQKDEGIEAKRVERIILSLPKPPPVEGLIGLDAYRPKGRGSYLPLIAKEAERQGLPAAVADAVVMVESSYNPSVIGTVGELGLMQVRPGTAAMLGFTGPSEALADPQVNIRYGIEYLAKAWRLTGGDLCRALMKYRAGHGEERMTPRSIEYCRRARVHLAAIGSPLANQGTVDPVGLPVQPVQVASAQPLPLEREPRLTIQEQRRAAFQRELVKRFIVSVANVGSQSKAEAVKRTGTLSKAGEVDIGRKPTVPLGRKP